MIVNFVAAQSPRKQSVLMRVLHIWVRAQQTKIYEGVSEALPNVI